jgi:hypothetical protein
VAQENIEPESIRRILKLPTSHSPREAMTSEHPLPFRVNGLFPVCFSGADGVSIHIIVNATPNSMNPDRTSRSDRLKQSAQQPGLIPPHGGYETRGEADAEAMKFPPPATA